MKFHDSVIMTIPSDVCITDKIILGKISDIHHFSTPDKLLAYAILDPSVYQSENHQHKGTQYPDVVQKISTMYLLIQLIML